LTAPTATPAARLEELTSLYERQAYVAWNIALRTALTEDGAAGAVRRAFLAQVNVQDEPRVALDSARLAAEPAPSIDPSAIESPLLAATAALAAAQRAALALNVLDGASADRVGAALGIDALRAEELLRRAREELAKLLATDEESAEGAYKELPWLAPPEAVWVDLYPHLHAAVTRRARARASARALDAAARPGAGDSLRRLARRPAGLLASALLVAAVVAWAVAGGGDADRAGTSGRDTRAVEASPSDSDPPGSDRRGQASTADLLSPEELDRLRREEIEDLKRFTRRKANKRLPPRERRHAARRAGDIVKLARARQREAERRELALRRALARERQARIRERNRRRASTSPPRKTEETAAPTQPSPDRTTRDERRRRKDESSTRTEAEAECLYDSDSGTYICPE
jgi:hypothetical protein